MSKIRNKIFLGIFTLILILLGDIPNSLASTTSQQQLKVKIELDESLVEFPIEDIKRMNYALEYIDGFYIVHHIINGEVKEQVITEEEAYYLGFIPNILDEVTDDTDFDLGILPNDKDIIILGVTEGSGTYKQVITEDEQELLKELLEKNGVKSKGDVLGVNKNTNNKVIDSMDSNNEEVKKGKDKKIDKNKEGYKVPVTATNIFNYMLIGVLLVMLGLIVYFFKGRKAE